MNLAGQSLRWLERSLGRSRVHFAACLLSTPPPELFASTRLTNLFYVTPIVASLAYVAVGSGVAGFVFRVIPPLNALPVVDA